MCIEKNDWEKVIEFHGHACPGLAKGYRVAGIALRELKVTRSGDEEIVAIVENDTCAVDAIQVLVGCTFGKGNLIFKDYGKQVYTFISRNGPKAIRISVNEDIGKIDSDRFKVIMDRIFKGEATDAEKNLFNEFKEKRTQYILNASEEELFKKNYLKEITIPERARIFDTLICAFCGEGVSSARVRTRDNKTSCIPCAENAAE